MNLHWIEDVLGLEPDGGSGTTELMVLAAGGLLLLIAGTALIRRLRRGRAAR
jgi:hypothetical protein